MIPDEAVGAAARVMAPAAWAPQAWQMLTFMAHGETLDATRARVQRQSIEDARRTLEAAAPFMLAEAWDAGQDAGANDQMAVDASLANGTPEPTQTANPYRPTP